MTSLQPEDRPNFGHALIGFFFWPIGLLAYLLLYDASPQRARSIGTGVALGMMLTFLGVFWLPFLLANSALQSYRSASAASSSSESSRTASTDFYSTPTPESTPKLPTPSEETPTVAPDTSSVTDEDAVRNRYAAWVASWQDKDIDSYLTFYASEATIRDADGKPYDVETLKTRRTKRWVKERDIKIDDIDAPEVSVSGDEATLISHRTYKSNSSNYSGTKTMTWRRSENGWLIINEVFKMDSSSIE